MNDSNIMDVVLTRCKVTKTYSAMREVPWVLRPLLRILYWWHTKVRGLHPAHAAQTNLIHRIESRPVTVQCECEEGHPGMHAHGGLMWEGSRMLVYGTRAAEMAFGKEYVAYLWSGRIFKPVAELERMGDTPTL